jgi:hypothetical protein
VRGRTRSREDDEGEGERELSPTVMRVQARTESIGCSAGRPPSRGLRDAHGITVRTIQCLRALLENEGGREWPVDVPELSVKRIHGFKTVTGLDFRGSFLIVRLFHTILVFREDRLPG